MADDAPATVETPQSESEQRVHEGSAWVCCRVCGRRIAPESARTSFDGGHRHRFTNPHGLEFRIRLFESAPGCAHEGGATEYFSWFPGYAWQIALCGLCRSHLGWVFTCIGPPGVGEPDGFHGLIVDRLRPES